MRRRLNPLAFVVIDSCPVPSAVAPAIKAIRAEFKRRYGRYPTLNSAYRGDRAKRLLARLGKHTQRFLYWAFVHHIPGYNPANPPTVGTHILYSDGVAYPRIPRGLPLKQWQCGFDWNDADVPGILVSAKALGIPMFQPYPTSSEYHHTNFINRPTRYM